jgi:hypothetical protein
VKVPNTMTSKGVTKIGLDMYLIEEEYVSPWMDEDRYKAFIAASGREDLFARHGTGANLSSDSLTVQYRVGYWRKADHIHKWFVDNVQDGVDECQLSLIEREQLGELYNLCKEVLEVALIDDGSVINPRVCEALLPSSDLGVAGHCDEWYIHGVERTVKILDALRSEDGTFGRAGMDYYYKSSW